MSGLDQNGYRARPAGHAPAVSVVMIFLNAVRFMEEAVSSVLAQHYGDWELLLVDDGSTDGSTALARRYAESEPGRIRYLQHAGHRNCGMSASRNLGIRLARGDYVAFLDADDVWLPHKLARQIAMMEAHPEAVMAFGDPLYWRSWSQGATGDGADECRGIWTPPHTVVYPPEMLRISYPLGRGGSPCPSDLLLRRSFAEGVGGFEEEFSGIYQMFEDIAFLSKVYLSGPVIVADECWTLYRIHSDSCVATTTRDGHYLDVRRFYLEWLRRYLRSHRVNDAEVSALLAAALRRHDPRLVRWIRRRVRRFTRIAQAAARSASPRKLR